MRINSCSLFTTAVFIQLEMLLQQFADTNPKKNNNISVKTTETKG